MGLALTRPVLVFDGACAFCRRWVARWRDRTAGQVRYVALQGLPLRLLGLTRPAARRAVQLVVPGRGRVAEGAEAVFRALLRSPTPEVRWRARVGLLPGVRQVAQGLYGLVARHRRTAAWVDRLLFGSVMPVRVRAVRWLVLRMLGGVFLVAFTSLGRQVRGLYGAGGILPIQELLEAGHKQLTPRARFASYPSVFWLTGASDSTLGRGCRVGQGLSVLLLLNVAPQPTLLLLWALYLSYMSTGRDFLSFQWDSLLLESALHGLLVAPPGLRPGLGERELTGAQVLAQRLLVLRLYFGSGLGKLQSRDRTWRDLTAMCFHHETTPLPTPLGWHAHQLPRGLQKAFTAAALGLELGPPFLLLGPRRVREAGFWLCAALQGGIALTGNYGFFNLLSAVLGTWALDDGSLSRALPPRLLRPGAPRPVVGTLAAGAASVPLILLSVDEVLSRFGREVPGVRRVKDALYPLRSSNSYALFSVMTTERSELSVEGSADGRHWRAYRFRFKPDLVDGRPRWVAPHMPRLDWQMWFAALTSPPSWFLAFLRRLLEGAPEVVALLAENPFPEEPPRYVRAVFYRYHMSRRRERRETGAWWRRERLGLYVPPLALTDDGRLRVAREAPGLVEDDVSPPAH